MRYFFWILTYILFLDGLNLALASTPEYIEIQERLYPRAEFGFAAGVALQTGYLTTQDSVGTYILGLNFITPGGLMSFDWQKFNVDHDTGEFQLNNKSVNVTSFSFIPYFRVLNKDFNEHALNIYLGVGLIEVTLFQADPEYMVNYGSFIFSGLLRYELSNKWSLQYKTQWFNVNQTINDQKTHFESWSHSFGAGYTFF